MRWSVPPAALKDDRAFVLAAVAQSGHLLQFASAPRARPTATLSSPPLRTHMAARCSTPPRRDPGRHRDVVLAAVAA